MRFGRFFLFKKKRSDILFYFIFFIIISVISIGLFNLDIDERIDDLLPDTKKVHDEINENRIFSEIFPEEEYIFIGVSKNPFSLDKINELWMFCNELENKDCIQSIYSPFNILYFDKINDLFLIRQCNSKTFPVNQNELNAFMKKLTSTRMNVGNVISTDFKSAGIILRKKNNIKEIRYEQLSFFQKIKAIFFGYKKNIPIYSDEYFVRETLKVINKYNKNFDIFYSGYPIIMKKTEDYTNRDLTKLIFIVLFVILIAYFLNFRSFILTFFLVICISFSVIITLGIMGWLGIKLNIFASIIPPFILTIGSSYTLYFINTYFNYTNLNESQDVVILKSLRNASPTIIVASLTTIIGFVSFFATSIRALKIMSVFIIISIIITVLLTFFLLPKLLRNFNGFNKIKIEKINKDFFSRSLSRVIKLVNPLKFLWIGLYFICLILFLINIHNLKIETNVANLINKNDIIYRSLIFFQKNFDGLAYFNITLYSEKNKKFFQSREGILAAKKIQDYIDKNVYIKGCKTMGWNFSIVGLLQDMNIVLTGKNGIPDERNTKKFINMIKAYSTIDKSIQSIIDKDAEMINFIVRTNTDNRDIDDSLTEEDFEEFERIIIKDLNELAVKDGRFTVRVWGDLFLMSRIIQSLLIEQIKAPILTLFLIFLTVLILLQSFKYSVFSLIPLTFSLMLNFLIMYWFKIPIDTFSIMIASVLIGIGIDDAMHFIFHYKREIKIYNNSKDAVNSTLQKTSRAIVFTSIALIFGFSVLFFSEFKPIKHFGLLMAISMINSTFATLFILPSFFQLSHDFKLKIFNRKKS